MEVPNQEGNGSACDGQSHRKAALLIIGTGPEVDWCLNTLLELQIPVAWALAPDWILANLAYVREWDHRGVEWVASPYWGLDPTGFTEAWSEQSLLDEGLESGQVFPQCGLSLALGLLVPESVGSRLKTDAVSALQIHFPCLITREVGEMRADWGARTLLRAASSNDPNDELQCLGFDASQPRFKDSIQLFALKAASDPDFKIESLKAVVNAPSNLTSPKTLGSC